MSKIQLTATDFNTSIDYENDGNVDSFELTFELRDDDEEFIGLVTINEDRQPEDVSIDGILKHAMGSLTFDAGDKYLHKTAKDFSLHLTVGQMNLIRNASASIQSLAQ